MTLKVGIISEIAEGERRVAIDPVVAKKLRQLDVNVLIEAGAGKQAHFSDTAYGDAEVIDTALALSEQVDVLIKVQTPTVAEVDAMADGSVLIGTLLAHKHPEVVARLNEKKITSFAMELVPRISRAQSMDVLSSQAAVAGYKAAIMGADLAPGFFPMLTTAAGTIRPSKVIVIGVGVAGLQAIATAKRLGAIVEAYDVRPETKEQIESLGAKAIELTISASGEGGYARELTDDERKQQQEELAEYIASADVLITTAAVPGRPAPKIIPESTVDGMKSSAVIIDLAAEGGGNCTMTQPGETVQHSNGVTIHAPLNVASQVPIHASEMYAKNIYNFLSPMIEKGELAIDFEDEVIRGALLTHEGEIKHDATREQLEGEA
ncbi:MAG TPA: NAD(P) transhydrogenase subunit alpha [Thiotrichaceae bacterium]|nr:NAD(P) transhydrogenase subunit alpha [Thiotrichaceae bacterium]